MNKRMNLVILLCLLAACAPSPSASLLSDTDTAAVMNDRQIEITVTGERLGYAWYEQVQEVSVQAVQFILQPGQGAGLLCRFDPVSGTGVHAIVDAVDNALFVSLYALNEFGERVSEDYALMKREPELPIDFLLRCIDEQATLVVGQGDEALTALVIDLKNDCVLSAGRNGYLAIAPQSDAILIHKVGEQRK